MYLEEIIVDGFKSYATRTTIGPFDPQFNAISGLNGTGKSNILDSICFVMGIKSLQQMRVTKLDELVYKQGQAGVTKASVTLVFRNDDRRKSPVGLGDHSKITVSRQIVVGGRDRFLMNGHTARPSNIQTIFQSVQLNVNNPHFLVMQGRITKVINMKPLEVLGMVEEAAGTRMYETKRGESMKKIATKETKLSEIERVIREEIEPTLEGLRKEQEDYIAVLRGKEELTRLERYCKSFEYYRALTSIQKLRKEQDEEKKAHSQLEENIENQRKALRRLEDSMREEETKLKKTEKGHVAELTEQKRGVEKELVIRKVVTQEAKKTKTKIDTELAKLVKALETASRQKNSLLETSYSDRQLLKEKQNRVTILHTQLEDAKTALEELRTGHISEKPTITSRQTSRQKLISAELQVARLESECNQLEVVISKWEEDLSRFSSEANKKDVGLGKLNDQLTTESKRAATITSRIEFLQSSRQRLIELDTRQKEIETRLAAIEDIIADLTHRTYPIQRLRHENPDGKKEGIEGLALELFHIKADNTQFAVALEEAGKVRLFNVVVQNDEVAKLMLEKYKNLRRITCIPMNRIKGGAVPLEKIRQAKLISKLEPNSGDIIRPLDLIAPIAPEYHESLSYVFGAAYICATPALAQMVSEAPAIKGLAITSQGDMYNPNGSVSGGSTAGLGGILLKYRQLVELIEENNAIKHELEKINTERQKLMLDCRELDNLQNELQTSQISIEGIRRRLEELREMSAEGQELKKRADLNEARERLHTIRAVELPKLVNVELPVLRREVEIPKFEAQMKESKTSLKLADKELAIIQQKTQNITRDLAVLDEQIETLEAQIEMKKRDELVKVEAELQFAQNAETQAHILQQNDVVKATAALERGEADVRERSSRFAELTEEKNELEKSIAICEAQMIKTQHSIKRMRQDFHEYERRRSILLRDHSWLETVQHQLNKPGGDFDFTKPDSTECFEKLEVLKKNVDQLQKRVNRSVIATLQAAENQLHGLQEKRVQLVRDKHKLEEFIDELDLKKKIALESCWKQVDENFSSIFSMLLPASDAHLSITSSGSLKDGLEMKVTLAGVTKSSLGELSGGQRSLLALALVLALLKYKPAPLYILDEIDAALDLNHTQSIGKMIRTQFRGSQFIVVSLKENLFNYADVLFRTSFFGGSSQIQRIQNPQIKDHENDENQKQHGRC